MLKLEVNFSYCRNTKMIKFIHKCFHNHTWQCMWVCMCVWVRVCVCVVCVCSMVCVVCVCAYVRVCVRASLVKWPGNQSTNWTNWKVVGSTFGVATLVLLFFFEEETLLTLLHCTQLYKWGRNANYLWSLGTWGAHTIALGHDKAPPASGLLALPQVDLSALALSTWEVPGHPITSLGWCDHSVAARDFTFALSVCV